MGWGSGGRPPIAVLRQAEIESLGDCERAPSPLSPFFWALIPGRPPPLSPPVLKDCRETESGGKVVMAGHESKNEMLQGSLPSFRRDPTGTLHTCTCLPCLIFLTCPGLGLVGGQLQRTQEKLCDECHVWPIPGWKGVPYRWRDAGAGTRKGEGMVLVKSLFLFRNYREPGFFLLLL